jgi:hypothetical protein
MVKLRHKGLLVLGVAKEELDALRDGMPLPIPLADLHESLMERIATAYENGATSPIEIAKAIPKQGRIQ